MEGRTRHTRHGRGRPLFCIGRAVRGRQLLAPIQRARPLPLCLHIARRRRNVGRSGRGITWRSMSDVLVVAPIHQDALQLMRDNGLSVTDARGKSTEEIRELLKSHRAILGRAGVKIDDELLSEAKQLRVVAVGSVGMDSLDLPYLYSRGLKVFNAAGGNRNAVAELAVGNAIALLRQTHTANRDLHKGVWPAMFERPPGNELWQKTVGIVGLGDIGSLVARLFLAFETTVISYDPYVRY